MLYAFLAFKGKMHLVKLRGEVVFQCFKLVDCADFV
jgi:hypothetical protein